MKSTPIRRGAVIAVGVVICLAILVVPLSSPVVSQDTANTRSLDVTVSAESTYVSQGESVAVDVTVQNTGDESSPAPVFDLEEPPSGWTVTSWSNADATYRSDTNEWLWTELEGGGQEQLSITLQASDNASGFFVSGELTDGYDNTANGEDEIIIGSAPSSTPSGSGSGGDGGDDSDDTSSGTSDTTSDDTDDTSDTDMNDTNDSSTDDTGDTNENDTNTNDTNDSSTDESTDDSLDNSTGDDSSADGTTDGSTSNNEASEDETTGDSTPGFGTTVALVAFIAAALIMTRRKH
ncbi:PGF-CTERM sorting domain-containing protein [Halorubrum sp. FL23]|uniref:PGF-CTERM sorting domain-containing protein n=1 Tax=Halorubrum sp. FL23 TaxID=3458704 RepID=UPI0040333B56